MNEGSASVGYFGELRGSAWGRMCRWVMIKEEIRAVSGVLLKLMTNVNTFWVLQSTLILTFEF